MLATPVAHATKVRQGPEEHQHTHSFVSPSQIQD